MGKVAVIIPNYNGLQYVEACIKSLEKQTWKDIQIILVDNASSDGSKELVKKKFPNVVCMECENNGGFSRAVNQGIEKADAEYVILLNNDTETDSNFVKELVREISKDEKLFSVQAKMISLHEPNKIDDAGDFYNLLGWARARGKGKDISSYSKPCTIFAACAGAAIYRKKVFEEIGLFDESHFAYLEDIDIGFRAKLFGYQNRFAPKAIVFHVGSASSGSRYNSFKVKLTAQNSILLLYKNLAWWQIILHIPAILFGIMVKQLFFYRKGLGKEYREGIQNGWKLCHSDSIRDIRKKNRLAKGKERIRIEWELWRNIFLF